MSFELGLNGSFASKHNYKPYIQWHVENKKPLIVREQGSIEWFHASFDELALIKSRFENLPSSHGVCIWYGDMAFFVFHNLIQ